MTTKIDYDTACRKAATDQGLDPLMDVLKSEGTPFELDQTGGFCMAIRVQLDNDRYILVTAEGFGEVVLYVAFLYSTNDTEGVMLAIDLPSSLMAELLRVIWLGNND